MMIGRKKLKDVQFITEVIESSINMEGARRFAYDPGTYIIFRFNTID